MIIAVMCVSRVHKCDLLVQEQCRALSAPGLPLGHGASALAIPSRCLLSPAVSRGTECSGGDSGDSGLTHTLDTPVHLEMVKMLSFICILPNYEFRKGRTGQKRFSKKKNKKRFS